jgi:hypothetical protein
VISPAACLRAGAIVALGVASVAFPPSSPHAQRRASGRERQGRFGQPAGRQYDRLDLRRGSMNRVQTWQDKDASTSSSRRQGAPGKLPAGVRAQRVGDSLELIVPTKPGASVTVQPRADRLDLHVTGDIDQTTAVEQRPAQERTAQAAQSPAPSRARTQSEERRSQEAGSSRRAAGGESATQPQSEAPRPERNASAPQNEPGPASQPAAEAGGAPGAHDPLFNQDVAGAANAAAGAPPVDAAAASAGVDAGGGFTLFSMTGLMLMGAAVGLVGLLC